MKLALIPPIELLEWTEETGMQLMLPHLLEDERYNYVYKRHCDDPSQYVILDNGEAEGVQGSWYELLDKAMAMGADEVVLPDVIRNARSTVEKVQRVLDKPMVQHAHAQGMKYMFVVQGSNWREFLQTALFAATNPYVDVIGIPRHMLDTCSSIEARLDLAEMLCEDSRKPVHLLGGSPLLPDELAILNFARVGNVRSTDTSSPFNYAYAKELLSHGRRVSRPEDYFHLPFEMFPEQYVQQNIKDLMEWTGNDL